MRTFFEWIAHRQLFQRLALLETFFPLDSSTYDHLFVTELLRVAMQCNDPRVRKEVEELNRFRFTNYIRGAVRNSGFSDPRELDERTHDVVSKLLLGSLLKYNPTVHGPFVARFKTAVANAVRNQVAKTRNHRRYFSTGPNLTDEVPARPMAGNEDTIKKFRNVVKERLGTLGLALLDLRLSGHADTKSLIGSPEHGSPSAYRIKQMVQAIKQLAQQFATEKGDEDFLRQVERAMAAEEATVGKRFRAKQGTGV